MYANHNVHSANARAVSRYVDAQAISSGRMPVRHALPLWLVMIAASWGVIGVLFELLVR